VNVIGDVAAKDEVRAKIDRLFQFVGDGAQFGLLKRQLDLLASGGKPQFRRTATGRYVTTGVVGAGQGNDSSPNIANTFSSNGDGGSSASTGGTAARSASVSTSGETSRAARRGLFGAAKGVKQRLFY